MRAFLHIVIPLVLPLLVYLIWANIVPPDRRRELLANIPWFVLGAIGIVLVAASLLLWALMGGEPAGGGYQAPRLEGDRVVPGRFER